MTQINPNPSDNQPEDPRPQDGDMTVDLTLDGLEEVDDLQALADEIADKSPEVMEEEVSNCPDSLLAKEFERSLGEAQARIQELEKHGTEMTDKHHRLLADFANFRNRASRDIQMAVDLAEKKLLLEVLPVLDSFERCLSSQYQSIGDFHAGVSLINKQFIDSLRRLGVEKVDLKPGDPFDAQNTEALTTTCDPSLPDGSIAAVFENGFLLRNSLLRPARVVVNHAEPSHHEDPESNS
ncbi:nucleotide exchange factor GrpE [Holophaga foetida]|uniref:nucleotide exchange factor GrpE n=1 Tax=Holophaga foetida TaxID=35839 RepID=UPI00024732E9|nr:nucleotide exchange factor GrpE [Holophaga foetida]